MREQDWSARGFARCGYESVFQDFGGFVRQNYIWLLFSLLATATGLSQLLHSDLPENLFVIAAYIVDTICLAGIAQGWHRRVLLNDVRTGLRAVRFDLRSLKFLAWAAVVRCITFADSWLAQVIPVDLMTRDHIEILTMIVYLIALYFALRLSLALPLIAIDAPRPIVTAWRLSDGDIWLLFSVLLLTLVPFNAAFNLCSRLAEMRDIGVVVSGLIAIFAYVLAAMGICVVSAAFSEIVRAKVKPGGLDPPSF